MQIKCVKCTVLPQHDKTGIYIEQCPLNRISPEKHEKIMYTILFTLVGVKNIIETKYDSGPPGGEWTCTKLYIIVRTCTEEVGGVEGRRTARICRWDIIREPRRESRKAGHYIILPLPLPKPLHWSKIFPFRQVDMGAFHFERRLFFDFYILSNN